MTAEADSQLMLMHALEGLQVGLNGIYARIDEFSTAAIESRSRSQQLRALDIMLGLNEAALLLMGEEKGLSPAVKILSERGNRKLRARVVIGGRQSRIGMQNKGGTV